MSRLSGRTLSHARNRLVEVNGRRPRGLLFDRATDSAAARISLVVAASLFACILIGTALEGLNPDLQVFESFGLAKRIGLPLTYLAALTALVIPFRVRQPRLARPFWWSWLYGLLVVSATLALIVNRQEIQISPYAQGVALVAGALLFAFLGLHAAEWSDHEQRKIMAILVVGAIVVEFGRVSAGPFSSVVIPATAGLIYLGLRESHARTGRLLLGLALTVAIAITILSNPNESIAFISQAGGCAGLLILALAPRGARGVLAVVGALSAMVAVAATGLLALMLGDIASTTDVTLTHRAYEAIQVYLLMLDHPLTAIFGLGPSGTVDLSLSPDAATLLSSGRDLSAVDDVHFLTSWLMLKFGVIGLIWGAGYVVAVISAARHVLAARIPDPFDCFLLFFVVSGLCNSFSAATNFYSNVLPALFLGVLYARRRARQSPPSRMESPS